MHSSATALDAEPPGRPSTSLSTLLLTDLQQRSRLAIEPEKRRPSQAAAVPKTAFSSSEQAAAAASGVLSQDEGSLLLVRSLL